MAGADPKRARAGRVSTLDRLSALPDELLLRVLSFLPAQQVVQTTVLSKRWTDLWLYATAINLDFRDFQDTTLKESWNRMEDLANHLLMLHRAPCIDAFRLRAKFRAGDVYDQRRHVDRWVRRAIKSNPLVVPVVEQGYFPVLEAMRTLILENCDLHANSQVLLHFMRNSPNLERLIIQHCKLSDDATREKAKAKSKKKKSQPRSLAHFQSSSV